MTAPPPELMQPVPDPEEMIVPEPLPTMLTKLFAPKPTGNPDAVADANVPAPTFMVTPKPFRS